MTNIPKTGGNNQCLCAFWEFLSFAAAFTVIQLQQLHVHRNLYLQADYNVIKRIDSGALRFLYKLRVLILNDNLIPVLPAHLFRLDADLLLWSY